MSESADMICHSRPQHVEEADHNLPASRPAMAGGCLFADSGGGYTSATRGLFLSGSGRYPMLITAMSFIEPKRVNELAAEAKRKAGGQPGASAISPELRRPPAERAR